MIKLAVVNVSQAFFYAIVLVLEACWFYLLMAFLNGQAAGGRLPPAIFILLFFTAFLFNRLIIRFKLPRFTLRFLNLVAWAIGMLLALKMQLFSDAGWLDPTWMLSLPLAVPELIYRFNPVLLLFIGSIAAWWLGYFLARRETGFTTLVGEFQFGLLMLILTFVIMYAVKVEMAESAPLAVAFFFFALLGISVAHAREGSSWLSGFHRAQWMWLLVASIILIILLGVGIAVVVSPDLLQIIVNAIKWIGRWILRIMVFIASLFPPPDPAAMNLPGMDVPMKEPADQGFGFRIPEELRLWVNIGLGLLWGGLVLAALYQISSQVLNWWRQRRASSGAQIEPMRGAFRADIASLLRFIGRKILKFISFSWLFRSRQHLSRELYSVRQVYRRLLRWGAANGFPRKPFQTPDEYLLVLSSLAPQAKGDLELITREYVSARYGRSLPSAGILYELQRGISSLREKRIKRKNSA